MLASCLSDDDDDDTSADDRLMMIPQYENIVSHHALNIEPDLLRMHPTYRKINAIQIHGDQIFASTTYVFLTHRLE